MDKRKKFCHVVFERFPLDERVRRYCNILREKGFHVYVICIKGNGEAAREISENLTIIRLPVLKKRSTFSRRISEYLLFEFLAFWKITGLFFFKRVRFYHVHTLPDFLVLTTLIPKIFGARVILDFHELFPEFMQQQKPALSEKSFLIRLIKLQEKISFKFADEVITFHDPAREILKKRNGNNKHVTTIMNCVDPVEMHDIKKIESKEFNLVYNGTINYNLNLPVVVKAFNRIRKINPDVYNNVKFHMYGDGPDLENIFETARGLKVDNIIYHGRLDYKDMYRELCNATALVLPPKRDIYSDLYYSGKLIESIWLKIPVIASRLNAYLFYYPEDCLIYFDAGNEEQLAEKIIELYLYPDIGRNKSENAFNRYQQFSWPVMRKRYDELIDRIAR